MKKHIFLFACMLCFFAHTVKGQQTIEPSLKSGKPSMEEMTMSSYTPDLSASAVVLYDLGETTYEYKDNLYMTNTLRKVKIKVLKKEGNKYATVRIPFYSPIDNKGRKDVLDNITGFSYNLSGSKIQKSSISHDNITSERIDDQRMVCQFTIPDVKEGSVIYYSYRLKTNAPEELDDWMMQTDIPTLYNSYTVNIPERYIFNVEIQGKDKIQYTQKGGKYKFGLTDQSNLLITKPVEDFNVPSQIYTFITKNQPAMPEADEYLWNGDDYKVRIAFELKGTKALVNFTPVSNTWEQIDNKIFDPENVQFIKKMNYPNPYWEKTKLLSQDCKTEKEKVVKLFRLLKNEISWNGHYAMLTGNLDKAVEQKSGNNSELNYIFMSMLRNEKIKCWPVLLRSRDAGRLPIAYPSYNKLNTFIVALRADSTIYYLDGSMEDAYFNVLPYNLSVDKARILSKEKMEKWVDISNLVVNGTDMVLNAKVDANGTITGKQETTYTGHHAINILKETKNKDSYVQQFDQDHKCKLLNYDVEDNFLTEQNVKEAFSFNKEADIKDGQIYINPMMFVHPVNNPFAKTDRQMPIDMPETFIYKLKATIDIPEGYEIAEQPKNEEVFTQDKEFTCSYQLANNGKQLVLDYSFGINILQFQKSTFKLLSQMWGIVAAKNNQQVILKKK